MFNPLIGILASSGAVAGGSYESIATVSVGSGGSSTITFSSIPATYKHLQIRGIGLGVDYAYFTIKCNSDTGSNYAIHQLVGDGSSVSAYESSSTSLMYVGQGASSSTYPSATIIDILDYTNTSKYKTFRTLNGYDKNGSGSIHYRSGLWQNTNAITQLDLVCDVSFAQYTTFALYGIKD